MSTATLHVGSRVAHDTVTSFRNQPAPSAASMAATAATMLKAVATMIQRRGRAAATDPTIAPIAHSTPNRLTTATLAARLVQLATTARTTSNRRRVKIGNASAAGNI